MTYLPMIASTQVKEFPHVTKEQAQMIWAAGKTLEIQCFVKTLWYTGLRISEVLRLIARDLRQEGNDYSLIITRSKKRKVVPETFPIPFELGESLAMLIKTNKIKPETRLFSSHENDFRYRSNCKKVRIKSEFHSLRLRVGITILISMCKKSAKNVVQTM
jgi:integrase